MIYHVLYNTTAGNEDTEKIKEDLKKFYPKDTLRFKDTMSIKNPKTSFKNVGEKDKIIVCGGDGTLNYFINNYYQFLQGHTILYHATGTGNDFLLDIGGKKEEKPVNITKYLKHLPEATVNGKTMYFLNNVGFGIDGYCTAVGDEMRKKKKGPINYGSIAVKGLLFHFKPTTAKVTVDGVEHVFNYTWLMPTMNGKYYGGGMMAAPDQNRLNKKHKVSVMAFYCKSRVKTLIAFPSIFSGTHIEHTDMVKIYAGNDIKVEFSRPTPLQVDGETFLNITSYEVHSK